MTTINPTPEELKDMERLAFAALPGWAQIELISLRSQNEIWADKWQAQQEYNDSLIATNNKLRAEIARLKRKGHD